MEKKSKDSKGRMPSYSTKFYQNFVGRFSNYRLGIPLFYQLKSKYLPCIFQNFLFQRKIAWRLTFSNTREEIIICYTI